MRRTPIVVISLTGCMALGSCSQSPIQPVAQAAQAPAPSVCALSDTEGNTCVRKANGRRICHLFVGVTSAGKPYVYPHVLNVTRGSAGDRERTLVWHSVDPRIAFTVNDGPIELKTNAQFQDAAPTNDPDGDPDPQPGQKRRYRITFLNTQQASHDYHIALSNEGTVLTCDPRINNSGD